MKKYEFITGNEAAVRGAIASQAQIMFGYPITPSTEILENWIKESTKNKSLQYLQTEDETSAGFAVCGSILAGAKAFTATAGPGHVLMQDPLSMAENLRLPFVAIVMQRGGPSTGTVNFSQQEVNLAAFGGNGDGLRIVYSASNVKEMYDLTIKAFSVAWKYHFPTILLGDGYLAKMKQRVNLIPPIRSVKSEPILRELKTPTHLRNCFSSEESFSLRLNENIKDWTAIKNKISESESYKTLDSNELIIAHGIIADVAREAINKMRAKNKKIGLFRPITLHPLDSNRLANLANKSRKIYIIESSLNQLSRIVKYELMSLGICKPIKEIGKPAESFSSDEIIEHIQSL